jgi:hypothetical protein
MRLEVGLCDVCTHARRLRNRRGSTFFLCGRAEEDARFDRYPRLPVLACGGFEPQSRGSDESIDEAEER